MMSIACFVFTVASVSAAAITSNSIDSDIQSPSQRYKRAAIGRHHRLISSMRPNGNWSAFLLNEHNKFRRQVPATNMQFMYWDPKLAASAQGHANTCDFLHSVGRRGVGENIWAASYADYSNAITLWFDEVYDPSCKCPHHYKACCGHYTQVVWAETNRMGCGAAKCRHVNGARGQRYVLVCHYTPSGNVILARGGGLQYVPAFRWQNKENQACSECPKMGNHTWTCDRGLCK